MSVLSLLEEIVIPTEPENEPVIGTENEPENEPVIETPIITKSPSYPTDYGFIITRHIVDEKTNKYWNQCVKLIRSFYPLKKIVVIDDNSNQKFVKTDFQYKNVEIIKSEYPRRGELLPYVYFYKNKWFDNAIIIHDSVFIHKRIDFSKFNMPVIPLWHFPSQDENPNNTYRIASVLSNNKKILNFLHPDVNILGLKLNGMWNGAFGCQSYIKHGFLTKIFNKYGMMKLINVVHSRPDRCSLERVFGVIFTIEYPILTTAKSLFGNIQMKNWGYSWDDYYRDFSKKKRVPNSWQKCWTGR